MSPRTREPSRERSMLDAALEVFLEKGFEGATILEIATRAQVGKGTLYGLAKSKEDLCLRVLLDCFQGMMGDLSRVLSQRGEPLEILRHLIEETHQAINQQAPITWLSMDLMSRANRNERLREQLMLSFRTIYAQFFAPVEHLIQEAIDRGQIHDCDAHSVARLLAAVIDGVGFQILVSGDSEAAGRALEAFSDLIERALLVREQTGISPEERTQ
jgi:AcrR family transcriptional regulator